MAGKRDIQRQYCYQENLAQSTFDYWLKKYKKEQVLSPVPGKRPDKSFIPVKVQQTSNATDTCGGHIEVYYPNGVLLRCPCRIDMQQLKSLINI